MKKEFSLKEKREYIFILSVLVCLFGNDKKVNIDTSDLDFHSIFKKSAESQIANMVSYGLNKAKIELPDDVEKRFVYNRKFMLMKDASQFAAEDKLIKAFEENGIMNLPVKGQFIKNTYSQPDFRTMSDVDIHVRIEDLPRIKELMESMDYTIEIEKDNLIIANQPPFVQVEIHGDNGEFKDTTFGDNLFNIADLIERKNYSYEFSLDNHYIYIVEHYAKHYRDVSGMGVRMICDMYNLNRALKDKLNWSYVNKVLKQSGVYKFHNMLVQKGKKYFENTLNEDDFDIVDIYILSNKIFGTTEISVYNNKKQYKEKYLNGLKKENYILSRFFPPVSRMSEDYPILEKSKLFLPFTWVHRNTKIIFSKDRKKYHNNIKAYKKYNDDKELMYLNEIMKKSGF